jgi:hypothetical protein
MLDAGVLDGGGYLEVLETFGEGTQAGGGEPGRSSSIR